MSIHLPADRDKDSWQLAIWNAHDAVLSRSQKLELMQMLESGFNAFDPFRVVGDLLANRTTWDAVLMCNGFPSTHSSDRDSWFIHSDLITLRDMTDGIRNVDTLYLLHLDEHNDELTRLVGGWSADELDTIRGEMVEQLLGYYGIAPDVAILRVWWD
jgi:hypothetical protein